MSVQQQEKFEHETRINSIGRCTSGAVVRLSSHVRYIDTLTVVLGLILTVRLPYDAKLHIDIQVLLVFASVAIETSSTRILARLFEKIPPRDFHAHPTLHREIRNHGY